MIAHEEEALLLPVEERISIDNHMNNYTKFLADLANVDEVIKTRQDIDSFELLQVKSMRPSF